MIMNVPVSLIPLLIIILLEMLMCWMNSKVFTYPTGQLQLLVNLVQKKVVLFGDHAVTVAAVSGEDLEAYVYYFKLVKEIPFCWEKEVQVCNYLF